MDAMTVERQSQPELLWILSAQNPGRTLSFAFAFVLHRNSNFFVGAKREAAFDDSSAVFEPSPPYPRIRADLR